MSVIIQMWRRLAPSRTKKLSTSWVMILRLTGRGKVAHCGLVNFLVILTYYLVESLISLLFVFSLEIVFIALYFISFISL